jgi:hypothetical protein
MRRKSRSPSLDRRGYPYVATLLVHTWRRPGGYDAVSRNSSVYNMAYYFKTAAEALAMEVWFENEGDCYDPWDEKLRRWESARRDELERREIVEGFAARGTWDRVRAAWAAGGREAAKELLRELEGVDALAFDRVMGLMPPRSSKGTIPLTTEDHDVV